MHGPAAAIIRQFGEVEADQRYTRLVELFTDDTHLARQLAAT